MKAKPGENNKIFILTPRARLKEIEACSHFLFKRKIIEMYIKAIATGSLNSLKLYIE
jgi:hypothetical protein